MQSLEMTPIEWRDGVTFRFEAPSRGEKRGTVIGILRSVSTIL